jgi:hypothetical protein
MPVNATVLNPDNVLVGTSNGPGIWVAPVGTKAPTAVNIAPTTPWNTLGYLSEDGVKVSQATDSQNIMSWQSKTPLRSFVTSREVSLEFTMLELSKRNFQLYFGQTVDTGAETDEFEVTVRGDEPAHQYAVLLDLIDGDLITRLFYPRASLSQAGDMEVTQAGAIGLPITMAAQDDNGVLVVMTRGKKTAAVSRTVSA